MKTFKRLLIYLNPYRNYLIVSILLLLFTKSIDVLIPYLIGQMAEGALEGILLPSLIQSGSTIILLLLTSYLIDTGNLLLKNWIGQRSLVTLRCEVFDHIQHLPLQYFDRHQVGKLMTYTTQDIDQINQMFSESIVPLFGSVFLLIGIVVASLLIDWQVGLMIIAILPFAVLLTVHFRRKQKDAFSLIRSIVSAMNSFIQEYLMGAAIIRHFGMQKKEKDEFEKINEDHKQAYLETIHHFSYFYAGIELLQGVMLIAVFAALVTFAPVEMGFRAGVFFTYSLYALMIFRPLGDLAERYNVLQSAIAAAERVFHILDEEIEKDDKADVQQLDEITSITFEDVWFAYEEKNWVLKDVSFHLERGESVALVGMTGAGKTTIMNLLLRFYDFQKGVIKVNGIDIRRIPRSVLRNHFSVVLQDPVIFSGTIEDNISLYDANITKEKMLEAMRYVNFETKKLSHHFVGNLSAGEQQLVSMARAVAQDRDVLILDEATANIDTPTEKVIQKALGKLLQEKTTLIIAHRLSTIQHVKRIIVLHAGEVREIGTHAALIEQKGIYEKLYRMQYV